MKNALIVSANPAIRSIKVQHNMGANKWGRILDAASGQVLHTGQPRYIKRLAKKRYGYVVLG